MTHLDAMTYPKVNETEIGGLQTFWVDVGNPFTATLSFRVGIVDETLPERGISHLVEHLALRPLRHVTHAYNGGVGFDSTSFWAAGSESDVVGFINQLCTQLRDPDIGSIDVEAGVLVAESMNFAPSHLDGLLSSRFGPHGPGVTRYPEYGLRRLRGHDVRRWAKEWFTADNAVLVLSGPPPDSLNLTLRRGKRRHLKATPSLKDYTANGPRRVGTQTAGIAACGYGARSVALRMTGQAVALRAQEHLRHELGRVYGVSHVYAPLTIDEAALYWGADSDPDHAADVADAFTGVLRSFADEGPTQEELDRIVSMTDQMDVADVGGLARSEAHRIAEDALRGYDYYDLERWIPEMRAVTPADGADAMQQVLSSLRAIVPDGSNTGFREPSRERDGPATGRLIRVKEDGKKWRWTVGEDAISAMVDDTRVTIRFEDVLVLDQASDGGCLIIDHRGSWLSAAPTNRKYREMIAEVTARIPPDRVVPPSRQR